MARLRPFVIIPAFNPPMCRLRTLVADIVQHGYPAIVVDDGSTQPVDLGDHLTSVTLLRLPTNHGVGSASRVGAQKALEQGATGFVFVDADYAHPLMSVLSMLDRVSNHDPDAILTNRFFGQSRRWIPVSKTDANGFAARLFRAATGVDFPDVSCGLRYISVRCVDLLPNESRFDWVYELTRRILTETQDYEVLDSYVDYSDAPHQFTSLIELVSFLKFCERQLPAVYTRFPELLHVARRAPEVSVEFDDQVSYKLRYIEAINAYWIQRQTGAANVANTRETTLSDVRGTILVPDGGRRWAKRENVQLADAYSVSVERIRNLVESLAIDAGPTAVCWYNQRNLSRDTMEVNAMWIALEAVTNWANSDDTRQHVFVANGNGMRSHTLGNVRALNAKQFRATGKPIVYHFLGTTCAFEERLRSEDLLVSDVFLLPWQMQALRVFRAALLIRTGGGHSLADMAVSNSSYAHLVFLDSLFNDVDLNHVVAAGHAVVRDLKYGT